LIKAGTVPPVSLSSRWYPRRVVMRIFTSFLIILCSTILWFLPVTSAVYDFRTDNRTDSFDTLTGPGITATDIVLSKILYNNDTQTINALSDLSTDAPAFVSYNATNRLTHWHGLTENTTREFAISYDVASFDPSGALNTFIDLLPWFWMIVISLFPLAALVYIWWGKITGTA